MKYRLGPHEKFFKALIHALGGRTIITSRVRSSQRQRELYARYQRGQSAYPVAVPGTSFHERGLAFDAVVTGIPDAWINAAAQYSNVRWAGNADRVHFAAILL